MNPICSYRSESELQPFKEVLKDFINKSKNIKSPLKEEYLARIEGYTLQDMNTIMSHLETNGRKIVTFIDPRKNTEFETFSSAKQGVLIRNYEEDIKKFKLAIPKLVMPLIRKKGPISGQESTRPITSIGNAQIILYGNEARELPHKKNAPLYNPTTLYIYEEDLQAVGEATSRQ